MIAKIPNVLTSARIALAPFVYYAGFSQERELFAILFALGGVTDVLDGFFARFLDMKSDWGSAFDTIADFLFYPAGLMLYFFVPEVITKNWKLIFGIIAIFVLAVLIGGVRKKLSIPHLASAKLCAALLYIFVLYTLLVGYSRPFLYFVLMIGAWAAVEQFIVLCFKSPSSRRWSWQ
jgi:phosphatidylglycerophosphate synthase